jgi:hypothetical protein
MQKHVCGSIVWACVWPTITPERLSAWPSLCCVVQTPKRGRTAGRLPSPRHHPWWGSGPSKAPTQARRNARRRRGSCPPPASSAKRGASVGAGEGGSAGAGHSEVGMGRRCLGLWRARRSSFRNHRDRGVQESAVQESAVQAPSQAGRLAAAAGRRKPFWSRRPPWEPGRPGCAEAGRAGPEARRPRWRAPGPRRGSLGPARATGGGARRAAARGWHGGSGSRVGATEREGSKTAPPRAGPPPTFPGGAARGGRCTRRAAPACIGGWPGIGRRRGAGQQGRARAGRGVPSMYAVSPLLSPRHCLLVEALSGWLAARLLVTWRVCGLAGCVAAARGAARRGAARRPAGAARQGPVPGRYVLRAPRAGTKKGAGKKGVARGDGGSKKGSSRRHERAGRGDNISRAGRLGGAGGNGLAAEAGRRPAAQCL